jgi:hypothetical protein
MDVVLNRFDGSSGLGKILTKNSVLLNDWNTVHLRRNIWNAYLRLNKGPTAKGSPKVYLLIHSG